MPVTDIDVVGGIVKVQTAGQDPHKEERGNISWGFNDTETLSFMCERTFQIKLEDLTIGGVSPGTKPAAETALDALFPKANTSTGGTGTDTSSGRLTGMELYWISGLTFGITAGTGKLNGTTYPFAGDTITLEAADDVDPRIDLIGVELNLAEDALQIFAITGEPAEDPAEPTYDNITQIRISIATISANAVVPDGVTDIVMYAENLGTPTEFNVAGTATFNKNSALNPQTGSKTIQFTGWTNGQYIEFTAAAPFNIYDVEKIIIPIRLTNNLNNNRNLVVSLRNGNVVVSNTIQATTKGLTRNTTGVYQIIVIDVSSFNYSSTTVNKMRITMTGSGSPAIAMVMDNIRFQKGLLQPAVKQNAITAVESDSGTFNATSATSKLKVKGAAYGIEASILGDLMTLKPKIVPVTYNYLVNTLWDQGLLNPGTLYKITDYATTHTISGSEDIYTGAIEPLIVMAIKPDQFSEEAISTTRPKDKIWWKPENHVGALTGTIIRRIDTQMNIDLPYDWRNVKFRRFRPDVPVWDSLTEYNLRDIVYHPSTDNLYMCTLGGTVAVEPDVSDTDSVWLNLGFTRLDYFVPSAGLTGAGVINPDYDNANDYETFDSTTGNVRITRIPATSWNLLDNIFLGSVDGFYCEGECNHNIFKSNVKHFYFNGNCTDNIFGDQQIDCTFAANFTNNFAGLGLSYSRFGGNVGSCVFGTTSAMVANMYMESNIFGTNGNNNFNGLLTNCIFRDVFLQNTILVTMTGVVVGKRTDQRSKIWFSSGESNPVYAFGIDAAGAAEILLVADLPQTP